jgi:signal transduction histidine kinase
MTCPRCQLENPAPAKFCLQCGAPVDGPAPSAKSYADLESENERLRRSLGETHAHVSEALEQQTATSEILRVISRSPTDVQPVFDAIAGSALRLCGATHSVVGRYDGELLHLAAHAHVGAEGVEAMRQLFPMRPSRTITSTRAILDRTVVHLPDVLEDPDYDRPTALAMQNRATLAVPMLRGGKPIGTIFVGRPAPQPFTEEQIELLKTFADQAVIAIENVRLFTELESRNAALTEALEQQTVTSDILRVISGSPTDVQPVLDAVAESAARLCEAPDVSIFLREADYLRVAAHWGVIPSDAGLPLNGETGVGSAVLEGETIHVADMQATADRFPISFENARRLRFRTALNVPLMRDGVAIGVISLRRNEAHLFTERQVTLLETFADQAVIALENVRLFNELQTRSDELEQKSRQLEAASQHKSEFLANMSHELRTPLNAVLGFSEVLNERLFGELNEKQADYLKDIHASGQHLLSLINDILDLSKIEAGRMELELTDFDLPSAIDNALMLVRERAGRRCIALHQATDDRLGQIRGDERKIKQVILNLLSNAIKFTPDAGRIDVRATALDGSVEVSVNDTGIGIAPEDQQLIFEEFRQVGTAAKTVEGTGLGLALSRKFIELHGGRIWVKSQVGAGSTFTFTIPMHYGE